MNRVFILEPCMKFPVKGVQKFGDVVYLYQNHWQHPPALSPTLTSSVIDKLREHKFDPSYDYIVATGKIIPLFVMAAAVASSYGKFNALCWDAREESRNYIVVPMGV